MRVFPCRFIIQLVVSKPSISARFLSQVSPKLYEMPERKPFQRLPENVKPINYAIRIQPDLKGLTFEGSEDISVKVHEKTKEIIVNSLDLDVTKASFKHSSSDARTVPEITTNCEDETLRLTFSDAIEEGDGCLSLSFSGKLKDDMKGFYRSKYEVDGEMRNAAVTQFEPTDARRAFPCWDEPALKASFDVTLVVPKDRVALSNMPVTSEAPLESNAALKVVTYDRTPVMSTYLLAWVVGEYDYIEARDENGVLHRVYTPLGKKDQGRFALDVSVKTLPYYTTFFKIPYPLPKIDLIALADFSVGAMENWGLVTYRETALLIDEANSAERNKLRVALVVCHELAHQWFGNLVTMEWWTHLWLNEGFASWIEYLCVDYLFPEYDAWTIFLSSDYSRALFDDALDNSHPIEVPVGHPSEIDEIFDAVSYSKGASVIRMIHHFIGNENFRNGLAEYLKKHAHSNTFTEDLWASLSEASGQPIDAIMTTWTSKMGFPLITVSQKQNGNTRVLHLDQKKFCASGEQKDNTAQWKVPISVSSAGSAGKVIKTILLESPSTEMTIDNIKPDDWIKVNPGCVDFYRVAYSNEMLNQLIPALADKKLDPKDRLSLQNDLFALSMAGSISTDQVFKALEAYMNETNFTVWSDISTNLAAVTNIINYTDMYDKYSDFIVRLYSKIAGSLGWDERPNESPLDSMLRGTVLAKMGYHGDAATIAEARRRFAAHCDGKETMDGNIRASVYLTVMAHGDEDTFNKLIELHDKADMQEETRRIQMAIGASKDETLIKKALDFALSDKVRNQDVIFVVAGATRTPAAQSIAWQFVQDNWSEFQSRFSAGFLISRLLKYVTENFVTEERAVEVEAFFRANPAPSAERTIQQSCENIRLNKNWLQRDKACIREFLE